jgi:hypothetical protein
MNMSLSRSVVFVAALLWLIVCVILSVVPAFSSAMTIVLPLLLQPVSVLGMILVDKVSRITAVADQRLIVTIPVRGILIPIHAVMPIRPPLIHDDLIGVIEIIITVPGRQP